MTSAAAAAAMLLVAPACKAGEKIQLAGGRCPPDQTGGCPQSAPDYPAGAKPGQCFAKVRTTPTYRTVTEQVVVSPARRETRTIPAVFETVDQRVLVSPERTERVTVPATYRTLREEVVVRSGGVRVEHVAPLFDTVVETVLVRPAHSEWRRSYVGPGGLIPVGARVQPTGEIMCLVQIPAVYDRVERRVLVRPGRTVEVAEPPVTRIVERQVVERPAQLVERRIPAVFRHERVRRIVRPERTEVVEIPAVTRTVSRQQAVDGGEDVWREIECPPAPAPPAASAPPRKGETPGIPPRPERGERG